MAIVHDIAEAIVGDITPLDGISKEEKSQQEQAVLDHMCKVLGGGSRAKEIAELWMEYEASSSPEAIFVKDLDKGLGDAPPLEFCLRIPRGAQVEGGGKRCSTKGVVNPEPELARKCPKWR